MGYFDIHSHVLYGLDDGSQSLEQSIDMLRLSYEQGVRHVIATPHYSKQFKPYSKERAEEVRLELEAAAKSNIAEDMEISLGQELFFTERTLERLSEGTLITMGDSRYVLIEFYPWESYYEIQKAVRELRSMGYRPILAHIERFEALADEDNVFELTEMGAYMQMNYGSISGSIFDKTASYCRKMLKNGAIHFLGTDMHNTDSRAPKLNAAIKWMKSHLNDEYLEDICWNNAVKMLKNERI